MPMYPNGIGQALGDTLATCEPLHMSGAVWYVSSAIGADATSPRGLDATRPLATLAQAVTNSASGDIIVLMDGHTETIATTGIAISKNLVIVGAGSSGGLPTAKLTPFGENDVMLTISGAAVQLRNIWIEERTVAATNASIYVTGASFQMIGCYCQLGALDYFALRLGSGANNARIVNTTFISTTTAFAAGQANGGIVVTAAISDLDLDGLVLSAGTHGFSTPYAFDGSAAAITRLKGQSVSLLLGADMTLHASTTGHLNIQTSTGGSRVVWAV